MSLIITYVVSVASSLIISRVMLKKYLVCSEQIFDNYLKQTNEIINEFAHDKTISNKLL